MRLYKGTYLERQELKGELVDEADGALFRVEDFNEYRIEPGTEPAFRRTIVSIDPATTSSESSDETGIVVAAEGIDNNYYTLADLSMRGTPTMCMETVVAAYHGYTAAYVVGEKNAVGDYMREALEKVDHHVPFKAVPAMKGKLIRAVPVSIHAAQGRIHMIGSGFTELEDQLSAMTPDGDRSKMHDDRADAWVWAMLELIGENSGSYKEMYGFVPCDNCGEDINEQLDKKCRHCGTPVPEKAVPAGRDRSTRWSSAYQKLCDNGHEFSMNLRSCPQCATSPGEYLAAVARLSGNNFMHSGFTGKDWFSGRRI